ncbi:metallophosphoesterase [uncultured Aquitalea sp.]|uniref:metallophosphoesterase family protein n=1 Tax=uncultured Aquitalea sp. TaxID=540272 RepID=UPI0025ED0721|nr:metallophosphoesterase [uncultured Aquitalea sp.]
MKLVHISDTHVGKGECQSRLARLVDHLLSSVLGAPEDFVVLHTGDVIDSAEPAYRAAGAAQLARLSDAGYRVFLCPGNHDYGDAMSIAPDAAADFQRDFAPWLFHGQAAEFPVRHQLDAETQLLVLDSNAAELSWRERWFAEGHLGEEQLAVLDGWLPDARLPDQGKTVIVALHHHPFYYGYRVAPDVDDRRLLFHLLARATRPFRRLKDAWSLCRVLQDRADILLYGHMHYGLDCSGDSRRYGIPLALDGGSSTDVDDESGCLRYRVVDTRTLTVVVGRVRL